MSNISRFIGNERGDKICHEDDGCPTELAVLKRFWREQQASTLPEEVANLVELLDEEEVPYEDSLGVALSLTGRTKQYANGKTATLREQVEKLTKELDNVKQVEFPRRVQKVTDALKRKHEKELAALAEQNEKQRKALLSANDFIFTLQHDLYSERCTDWYPEGAHNAATAMSESMRLIGNRCADFTDVVEALTIPDLASPVLNRIRAEAMEEAAKIANEHEGVAWAVSAIRNRKAELEKSNG